MIWNFGKKYTGFAFQNIFKPQASMQCFYRHLCKSNDCACSWYLPKLNLPNNIKKKITIPVIIQLGLLYVAIPGSALHKPLT